MCDPNSTNKKIMGEKFNLPLSNETQNQSSDRFIRTNWNQALEKCSWWESTETSKFYVYKSLSICSGSKEISTQRWEKAFRKYRVIQRRGTNYRISSCLAKNSLGAERWKINPPYTCTLLEWEGQTWATNLSPQNCHFKALNLPHYTSTL